MDDNQNATSHDTSRPAATNGDTDYTLSLEQVSELYAKAGHPRTLRSLQRYCVNGHLDAQKIATTLRDKYLVTPQSVARHIAQIEELNALERHRQTRTQLERTVEASAPCQRQCIKTNEADTL